ncbi:MAG: hypothetical protein EOP45_23370 [Sphingobacteriaceae bacterium]|nr:MAG: hypothetical protein EOP45_23370 [Sphingobacteriaceae bacterium]
MLKRFIDADGTFFYYTAVGQPDVVIRKKEWYDGATPAGNSIMVANLSYLSSVFDKPEWKQQAADMIVALSAAVIKYPSSFANAGLALQLLVRGEYELSVNGETAEKALKQLVQHYWPDKIVQTQQSADNSFPLFQNRWPLNGKCEIYLCKNQTCNPPVNSVAELLNLHC